MPVRRYEFRVSGRLSERAQGAFAGMVVQDAPPETIIHGDVVDDSQLHGVLAMIQNLGLHVVSVNEIATPPEPECARGREQQSPPPDPGRTGA